MGQNANDKLDVEHEGRCERLLVVHLSDIHVKDPTVHENPQLNRKQELVDAIASRAEGLAIQQCLVIVTGDIAYSGLREEYRAASTYLTEVVDALESRTGLRPDLHVLPGNHDCDFSDRDKARDVLLRSPEEADVSIAQQCVRVQEEFLAFATELAALGKLENPLASRRQLFCGDHMVEIISYNTAWCSQKHEQQGALFFPAGFLLAATEGSALTLTAFHHPYSWLESANSRVFREHVERTSDMILTGHEHVPGRLQVVYESGKNNEYVEGGVLQDSSEPSVSGFNILCVDFKARTHQTIVMSWSADEGIYLAQSYPSREFKRNQQLTKRQFRLRSDFHERLLDPGEQYKHPKKVELQLTDIYVEPYLSPSAVLSPGSEEKGLVRAPLDLLLDDRKMLICGAELAGKTALARMLFLRLHRSGIVPVSLSGAALKSEGESAVEEVLQAAFVSAYGEELFERWRQLQPQQRAILIDDVHLSPLSVEGVNSAIGKLERYGSYVVVLGSENFAFSLVEALRIGSATLLGYACYSMEELGARLRYELIEKWCFVGARATDDRARLSTRAQRLDSMITRAIGENILPPLPSLVLLCLQQIDSQTSSSDVNMGSFGHLYEALITSSLLSGERVEHRAIDLDGKITFLSHFAYELFRRGEESLSLEDFERVYDRYAEVHDVSYPKVQFLDEVRRSKLTLEFLGRVRFRYPYGYCFFVAAYLRRNLGETETLEVVRSLCGQVHHEVSANIVLFLAHLSRDKRILDTLLERARSLFPDSEVPDLHQELAPLGTSEYVTKLQIRGEPEERRREERDQRDRLASSPSPSQMSRVPELTDYVAAQRTVQIMGQVLRSYPGSLGAQEKLEILREAYALGMRAAGALIRLLVGERQEIAEDLARLLVKQRPELSKDLGKVRAEVQRFLARLCCAIYYSSVLHVSDSVGLPALRKTYDRILCEEGVVAFQMIDVSIRLDHFDVFPEEEVGRLSRGLHGRPAVWSVLRKLIWRHLYLFPVDYRRRQQLCDQFEIKATPLLRSREIGQNRVQAPRGRKRHRRSRNQGNRRSAVSQK